MAFEKSWAEVTPQSFTSDGTADGVVTVASTAGFYVKQLVIIKGTALADLNLQVKRVTSATTLIVGPEGQSLDTITDISTYTVAAGSTIAALVQRRVPIPTLEIDRAVYAEEPIVATRVVAVDSLGAVYSATNPMPTVTTSANYYSGNMGFSAFDLSTGNTNGAAQTILFQNASIQITWTGATSSDVFAVPGTITIEISNDSANWETLFVENINAASGSFLNRSISCDFLYMRAVWTKHNITGGSLTIAAIAKGI